MSDSTQNDPATVPVILTAMFVLFLAWLCHSMTQSDIQFEKWQAQRDVKNHMPSTQEAKPHLKFTTYAVNEGAEQKFLSTGMYVNLNQDIPKLPGIKVLEADAYPDEISIVSGRCVPMEHSTRTFFLEVYHVPEEEKYTCDMTFVFPPGTPEDHHTVVQSDMYVPTANHLGLDGEWEIETTSVFIADRVENNQVCFPERTVTRTYTKKGNINQAKDSP